jgi:uncharacterized protein (UPF0262 family)
MADHRIVDIRLDEQSIVRRSPEVEHERAVAIYDILERNHFVPSGDFTGPYVLHLKVQEHSRLIFGIHNEADEALGQVILPLTPFRRLIRDYFKICESYYDAIKRLTPSQIETIDMARRSVHDEGSNLLIERLEGKIEVDLETARRLFTLICVLHIRG